MPADERPDEWHDPATLGRALAFRLETADDPAFRAVWARRSRMFEAELVRSIDEARAAGELTAGCDPRAIGRLLHAALSGVTVDAAWRTEESVQARLRETLAAVLGPYRTPQSGAEPVEVGSAADGQRSAPVGT